jgi:hypothetical protein
LTKNNPDERSPQDSNTKLWNQQTTIKTSWHLRRYSGLHAWERFLATGPALSAKELHSIRLLAILFDRNSVPFEFCTIEAISAWIEVLITGAGKTEEIIVPSPTQVTERLALLILVLAKRPIVSGYGPEGITAFDADAARAYGLPPNPIPPWQEPKIVQYQSGPQPPDPACQPSPAALVTSMEEKVLEACTEYIIQLSNGELHYKRKWHSPTTHQQKRETAEAEQFLSSIHDLEARPLSAKERAHQRRELKQLGRKLRGEAERRDTDRRKDTQK